MINKFIFRRILKAFPYELTGEQLHALHVLSEFLTFPARKSLLMLNGYAGTGKTSLLGAAVKALRELHQPTVLLAPTGRAAKVFSEYAGGKAFTIHKKIYRQKTFSNDLSGFSLTDNLHKDTIFIVDEASMISNIDMGMSTFGSGRLLDDLIYYVYGGEGCKLILLGDAAQLSPVSQADSPAMNIDYLKGYGLQVQEISLTQVVRQDKDSGILFNATLIRENLRRKHIDRYPILSLKGFKDICKVNGEELIEEISSAYSHDGLDDTIIICRSNKRATLYNNGVRNRILYREEEISSGDRLMVVKNNYFWMSRQKGEGFIANGEVVEVLRVRRMLEMHGLRFCDVLVRFQDYESEVELRILLDTLQSETPALPKELSDKLFYGVLNDYDDEPTKAGKMKKIKVDPFYNALQVKYAYAITCHKAQGGQWRNVFLDIGYVTEEMLGEDFYRWLYTAFTRATHRLYLVNLPEMFEEKEMNK